MSLSEKFEEILSQITAQEENIEKIANDYEQSGNMDPSFEDYLFQIRSELKQRREAIMSNFRPKVEPIQIETSKNHLKSEPPAENSPKAKIKSNTPTSTSSRTEKFPFYSVHQIEVDKNKPNLFKKMTSGKGNSPAAGRYSPHSFKDFDNPFAVSDNHAGIVSGLKEGLKFETLVENSTFNGKNNGLAVERTGKNQGLKVVDSESTSTSLSREKSPSYAQEKEVLLRDYYKCREIMNSAHEAMLLIKEKMLEIKEKELSVKMSCYESTFKNLDSDFSDVFDAEELEEQIKQPIFIHGTPVKQNMQEIRIKEEKKKVGSI
jgi:hypothetical protein